MRHYRERKRLREEVLNRLLIALNEAFSSARCAWLTHGLDDEEGPPEERAEKLMQRLGEVKRVVVFRRDRAPKEK